MGMDFRGDPSSALLEVLDPEQNSTFMDHYLEVEYDLSDVMFVTTANTLNIPAPLMDRMEIIRIAGYTEDEKVEIAPAPASEVDQNHGLKKGEFEIDDEAMRTIIRRHARGWRAQSRARASTLSRKAIKEPLTSEAKSVKITPTTSRSISASRAIATARSRGEDQVGVVTGLAWTEFGGELLVEGVMMPGKGKMTVTGNLRDVMKESISAAASYVRSRARLRHQAAALRQAGHPCPRAGGRDAEGRPVGGHRDGDRDRLGDDRHSGQEGCRHDRRDHAPRARAPDRRAQGEAACRAHRGGIKKVLIPRRTPRIWRRSRTT